MWIESAKFLRERSILFCLDGIQSFGALRTSMEFVDFAAADAHKWLLGPLGTRDSLCAREHFERFHPPLVGWNSASSPNFIAQESLAFRRDARRYEPGSLNLAGIVGLRAALQLILECGIEPVEARVLALAEWAIACGAKDRVHGPRRGGGEGAFGYCFVRGEGAGFGEVTCKVGGDAGGYLSSLPTGRAKVFASFAAFLQSRRRDFGIVCANLAQRQLSMQLTGSELETHAM